MSTSSTPVTPEQKTELVHDMFLAWLKKNFVFALNEEMAVTIAGKARSLYSFFGAKAAVHEPFDVHEEDGGFYFNSSDGKKFGSYSSRTVAQESADRFQAEEEETLP